jgi:hypothetical protein
MPLQNVIAAESVGALLRGARVERGLSTADVAGDLHFPETYVTAFENDDHWRLPDDAYTKLYLKAYAAYLGFNTATLVRQHAKERGRHVAEPLRASAARPQQAVPAWMLWVTPSVVQTALLVTVALGIVGYFGYELKRMVAPPEIVLASPLDGLVTKDRTVSVTGTTEPEVTVRVNGKAINPDLKGKFSDTLELQDGLNLITIKSAKKHSKEVTLTRRVIVMPTERPAAMMMPVSATLQNQ